MSGKMQTPWGTSQMTQQLENGVFWVETATHGGLLIENAQAKTMLSEKALEIGQSWHDFIAFEQEHDMMVVFYEHPEWYPWVEEELTEKLAEDSLRQHHPQYFGP
ncbi:hypothetical protein KSF_058920 [Reticulibacter mediterranei]|uniref:DUF7007 domain-containing protein n=1 Tax=Reticulibacter mediterranei TaxID=2778369 RepID=A0A8J3N258_9CHLR|nr:hypothetical protein [Reticulibacter mediterranei]GHO95844.1 hypothetical protein KSF_058920 [Reticulibacter mediterranei]